MSALLLAITTLMTTGCSTPDAINTPAPGSTLQPGESTSMPSPPPPPPAPTGAIIVKLSFSEPPLLGKPVQVIANFSLREGYKQDATNTTAEILLERGFELVDGSLNWNGALMRGESVELSVIVKAIKTGETKIQARAFAYSEDGTIYTHGYADRYAYVSEDNADISDIPLKPEGVPSPEPAEPPPGIEAPAPVFPVPSDYQEPVRPVAFITCGFAFPRSPA